MFGISVRSFADRIVFGAASGGGGGSGTSNDPYALDPITLSSEPDHRGDGNHSSGSAPGAGNTGSTSKPVVEIIDVNYVETAILSASGNIPSGKYSLVIAEEYIIEHQATLEVTCSP